MEPDSTRFGFSETVELLSNVLPARALQLVTASLPEHDRERLARDGIDDGSIAALLDEQGVLRLVKTRQAVRTLLGGDEGRPDAYAAVDPAFRGEGNPFIEDVRALVRRALSRA